MPTGAVSESTPKSCQVSATLNRRPSPINNKKHNRIGPFGTLLTGQATLESTTAPQELLQMRFEAGTRPTQTSR